MGGGVMNGLLRVFGWVVIVGGAVLYLAVSVVTMNFLSSIPLLIQRPFWR